MQLLDGFGQRRQCQLLPQGIRQRIVNRPSERSGSLDHASQARASQTPQRRVPRHQTRDTGCRFGTLVGVNLWVHQPQASASSRPGLPVEQHLSCILEPLGDPGLVEPDRWQAAGFILEHRVDDVHPAAGPTGADTQR